MNYKTLLNTLAVLALSVFSLIPTFAQDDTAEFRQSFFVCDWGLVVVQHDDSTRLFDISIDSPSNYSPVTGSLFTISGTGKGLFEANLVVEVTDTDGNILFAEPTLVDTDEIGGEGNWSMNIDLSDIGEATPVTVRAYSTEPEEGRVLVEDSIRLNLNSDFGLSFVDITRPIGNDGVSTSPLLIEGVAGAIFENNIVVQILDGIGGNILAETFATVETEEFAGQGEWSTELDVDLDIGTPFVVYAFQPQVADEDIIDVDDTQFGVASPLAQSYNQILVLQSGDPLTLTDDLCGEVQAEFENDNISPILVNDLQAISTMSMTPLVNVTINTQKPSRCDMPMRLRINNNDNEILGELYYSTTDGMAMCSRDLQPFSMMFSLGTLPNDTFSVSVNDVELQ